MTGTRICVHRSEMGLPNGTTGAPPQHIGGLRFQNHFFWILVGIADCCVV